jgi:hypothetical protein
MGDQATSEYLSDISHYSFASSEASACTVEPGSAEDVSKIVRSSDPLHQLFPTRIFIAMYPGTKPNTICSERWGARHKPGIFLNERRADHDVPLQRDKSKFNVWDS